MWKELLIYALIILCIFIFIKLGRLKFLNRKVLSLWQRIIISVGLTSVLVIVILFGSVFLILLFLFVVLIGLIVLLFGGRLWWKRF